MDLDEIVGPLGQARWLAVVKAFLVAKSLVEGAMVNDVARWYDRHPSPLSEGQRTARQGTRVLPARPEPERAFAPMVMNR
jgi:transposase